MSRRTRLSEQTSQEIKDIARRLMAEKGTAGLSIRAIAREIDMTPPAIYTYFANLDELITTLIIDAFNAYADALEAARDETAAAGGSLTEQITAVTLAYRSWALAYPTQFKLIYGSPIPGYHAPRDLTLPAVLRTAKLFMSLMVAMWEAGDLPYPDTTGYIPPDVYAHLRQRAKDDTPDVRIYGMYQLYGIWMALHGMVTLEVFNHLQATVGDTEGFFRAQMAHHYHLLGLKLPSSFLAPFS